MGEYNTTSPHSGGGPPHFIEVAIKSLKQDMVEQCQEEFEEEIRTMGKLDHPNIVKLIGQCHRMDNGNYCTSRNFS